jgi:hypothetical protein
MDKIIAFCGLDCAECPGLIATQKNDDNERRKVAELWNKEYKTNVKPEDINCLGCITESVTPGVQRPTGAELVFNYCKVCEIRKCGRGKKIKNCAYCVDYPCELLNKFLVQSPKSKANLEEVRKTIKH